MILPDLLVPGLRVVFCGTAAGTASATARAYYAGPGNRFWSILHETGLTPRRLAPREFRRLLEWGIGLTDVSKTAHGMDDQIAAEAFDPARLWTILDEVRPHAIAFNGKNAARLAFGLRDSATIHFGPAAHTFGAMPAWVLPSTSGAGRRYWEPAPWHALAAALPSLPHCPRCPAAEPCLEAAPQARSDAAPSRIQITPATFSRNTPRLAAVSLNPPVPS